MNYMNIKSTKREITCLLLLGHEFNNKRYKLLNIDIIGYQNNYNSCLYSPQCRDLFHKLKYYHTANICLMKRII
jgi:hypothetical protein